jgi:hypothetical protein
MHSDLIIGVSTILYIYKDHIFCLFESDPTATASTFWTAESPMRVSQQEEDAIAVSIMSGHTDSYIRIIHMPKITKKMAQYIHYWRHELYDLDGRCNISRIQWTCWEKKQAINIGECTGKHVHQMTQYCDIARDIIYFESFLCNILDLDIELLLLLVCHAPLYVCMYVHMCVLFCFVVEL